jgi:hypothetical protein
MSLDYKLTGIEDYENRCWQDDRLNPVTEVLVFMTMPVGINHITDKNVDTFYARLKLVEALNGSFLRRAEGEPHYLSMDEVRAHIGLWTNAPLMTDAQFRKNQVDSFISDQRYNWHREQTRLDAERKERVEGK